MAQKIQVDQVSDLDGAPASEKVRFALDGTEYEIDLSAGQAGEMRGTLAPYVTRARRKAGTRRRRGARRPSRPDLPEIREYARARGYDVRDRGQVPRQIVEEYDALSGQQGTGGAS